MRRSCRRPVPPVPKFPIGFICCLLLAKVLVAQHPVVPPNGFVNAASYGPYAAVGGLASLFGTNLATQTASATGLPLPIVLGGTTVTIGGVQAPLLYVSPGQINLQVPTTGPLAYLTQVGAAGSTSLPLIVTSPTGSSDQVTVAVQAESLGIFTQDSTGCGQAAILNVNADGSVSLNSPGNSVAPGGAISVFATGLGGVIPLPADGTASPLQPLATSYSGGAAIETGQASSEYMSPTFIGRAPGFVGLDQLNLVIPSDASEKCAAQFQLISPFNGKGSQIVPISVKKGGGQCVDPPSGSYMLANWIKTVYSGSGTPPPSDQLSIQLSKGPGLTLPAPTDPTLPATCTYNNGTATAPNGICPAPGVTSLNAGVLTIQTPSFGPQAFSPISVGGMPQYSIALPSGSIGAGNLAIQARGGADVGSFQTNVVMQPIQVTSAFPPGTQISNKQPVTVTWTGGNTDGVVAIRIIGAEGIYTECRVPASLGSATIQPCCGQFPGLAPAAPQAEIMVFTTSGSHSQTFSATGLTGGGRTTWQSVYLFANLSLVNY